MFRFSPLPLLALLAGCTETATQVPDPEFEQKAGYAVAIPYPRTPPAGPAGAWAIFDPQADTFRIFNETDCPLAGAALWIDGAYVQKLPPIAPKSSVLVRTRDSFDLRGLSAEEAKTPVTRLEIQRENELYEVPMARE